MPFEPDASVGQGQPQPPPSSEAHEELVDSMARVDISAAAPSIVRVTPSATIADNDGDATRTTASSSVGEQRPAQPSFPTANDRAIVDDDDDESQRHCRFVLLAEFDIDKGSTLSHQYPAPTGYNEHMLAELMLPDGAHARVEDWTVFFLKPHQTMDASKAEQVGSAAGSRGPSMDSQHRNDSAKPRKDADWSSDGLTYVINLVRTKHDSSVRRGALVKSMAIGTRHPYIDIFKPVLLLALDDYFKNPGTDCLARLYDAVNQLDLSSAPIFSRPEKLILRASDRRDLFQERFLADEDRDGQADEASSAVDRSRSRADSGSTLSEDARSLKKKHSASSLRPIQMSTRRGSSATSLVDRRPSQPSPLPGKGRPRDTHFYDTTLGYRQILLPIRVPLAIFPEEVGEYSLIKLIQTFSGPQSTPLGPLHPHLHSNGHMTHPIILLFNALVTQKRVVFLGHGQPANLVASYVLAACALGSGCGAVFRGFASRAFPYTNLMNLDELETVPGYIAGVTNPRFEDLHAWDVLLNVETGKIQVSKDLAGSAAAVASSAAATMPARSQMTRDTFSSNSISSLAGNASLGYESSSKASSEFDPAQFGALPQPPPPPASSASSIRTGASGRDRSGTIYDHRIDSPNTLFMEDISSAIQAHYGERYIRSRITDFVSAFAKCVSRHEEHFYGHTKLGPNSQPFLNGQLGSGPVFLDRDAEMREIQVNQLRVEGFRASIPYRLLLQDELEASAQPPLLSFDLSHQIGRLRRARHLLPGESERILLTIATSVVTDEQIVELLSLVPLHAGGLLPLGFGLFHPSLSVRGAMVDFFLRLSSHPVGKKFVQSLNTYQRLAFARLANDRLSLAEHGHDGTGGSARSDDAERMAQGEARDPEGEPGSATADDEMDRKRSSQVQAQGYHPFRVFSPGPAAAADDGDDEVAVM
ncbi:uncharacterized protein PFL1_05563 [Pseudozyma flocculosa PF-1]|uniref:UDENN domain-containing protein n=2 Tax=Pseudozyma flocculosa TaxID=84751 RepID=A0A5C3F9S0_9BASI|nr:uncharacterized protein PFL1_05563 [Pseudozyma flocculosa PF-1]EPQ26928.1 hypothetical protein PFL1_05563 [Pseudozyma flocculosa PF-1]SPO41164.1 uncharacterized protein PSFLO_06646 [Pseudozyma flocculosa]